MHKLIAISVLSAALVGSTAFSQYEEGGRVEREAEEVTKGAFASPFHVVPRVGALGYQESTGDYATRITEGITLQYNISNAWRRDENPPVVIGIESGLLYSHIGGPSANFLGSTDEGDVQGGANSFLVPMNLVAGYRMGDSFSISALVGANLLYKSIGNSMILGREGDGSADDQTELFPGAGLNFGWGASNSVALSLRGDYIPTPADDMFTATLGATFGLG